MRRFLLALCALILAGCCSAPPAEVTSSLEHMLADLPLIESELLPLVPADAEIEYTTITGSTGTKNARQLWSDRVRAFLFRQAGLVAWARGEEYDEEAAFAALFPDRVR